MLRLRGLIVSAGLSLGLLAGVSQAIPPALEKAPSDAVMIIAVPNPDKMQKNLQSLTTATELPLPMLGISDALAMLGIHGGVATDKSLAIAVMSIPDENDDEAEPKILAIVPVTSYADFLDNFGAKPGAAGGIDEFEVEFEPAFARDIGGGYAAMSNDRALVADYKPGDGRLKAEMGAVGERLADTSDVVIVMNVAAAMPAMRAAAARAGEGLGDQLGMMGVDAGAAAENPMAQWVSEQFMDSAKVMVGGLKAGGLGLSLEMSASFKEGSLMADMFATRGNANALMGKLPNAPFLLAGALDTAAPGVKKFFKTIADKSKEMGAAEQPGLFTNAMTESDGQSFAIGMSPTMLMGGGLLTNTVQYTKAANPDAAIASIKADLGALNGKTIEGMTYEFTYKDGGAKVGDKNVDSWQLKMQSDGSDPMAMQAMAMIFGPSGGPGGYLSKVDGGLVRTYARNSKLMGDAMGAASGKGPSLASDAALAQVASQMPQGRVAEAYIGIKNILDMVLPMAAMFGVQMDLDELPETLPPIGLAIAGEGGSAHLSVFLPSPVLKVVATMAEAMGPQFMDMGDFGDMDDFDADQPTGQPRF
ncbi:MAG: hypothetical protein KF699_05740 [Phycisphaeraceae bacterium]|nr:hypothetical protein [Phycisphaeraceae bacterium]MBX3407894.1 hypothetical protein [Phycisphaeraceae bacterium]